MVPVVIAVDAATQSAEQSVIPQEAEQTAGDQSGPPLAELSPKDQSTIAIQTDNDPIRSQLLLAQQGQLPLAKDGFATCQAITSSLERVNKTARGGYIRRAQQELFEVSV